MSTEQKISDITDMLMRASIATQAMVLTKGYEQAVTAQLATMGQAAFHIIAARKAYMVAADKLASAVEVHADDTAELQQAMAAAEQALKNVLAEMGEIIREVDKNPIFKSAWTECKALAEQARVRISTEIEQIIKDETEAQEQAQEQEGRI